MAKELKVPEIGESISEVMIAKWLKQEGELVARDEPVCEIESDKATFELPAPVAGKLTRLLKQENEMATVGEVLGFIDESAVADAGVPTAAKPAAKGAPGADMPLVMPAARRLLFEEEVDAAKVQGTGKGGRVLKEDVERAMRGEQAGEPEPPAPPAAKEPKPKPAPKRATRAKRSAAAKSPPKAKPEPAAAEVPAEPSPPVAEPVSPTAEPPSPESEPTPTPSAADADQTLEDVVPMSPIRRTIARRLIESQQTAAQLTTFSEADMSAVIALRKHYQEQFQQRYGIKLGFMSFFVKAAVEALKAYPAINAEIRDQSIVYKNYYHIGIAVGGGKGLVVPVVRHAERLSFAEIERAIADFANRARDNQIELSELSGGTFSITNGGVYGSMLATPILNPPQSGILGLHAITERPVVVLGKVVVRPMMYLALTYDHRLVDGREAVLFLRRVRELIEDPSRLILEV